MSFGDIAGTIDPHKEEGDAASIGASTVARAVISTTTAMPVRGARIVAANIEVMPTSKIAWVSEELCIGCGICVKKCPFGAVNIINLPKNLQAETTHRYGPNSFKLHRLPVPRPGQVSRGRSGF